MTGWQMIIGDKGGAHFRWIDEAGETLLYSPVFRDQQEALTALQSITTAIADPDLDTDALTYLDRRDPASSRWVARLYPDPGPTPVPLAQDPPEPIDPEDRKPPTPRVSNK